MLEWLKKKWRRRCRLKKRHRALMDLAESMAFQDHLEGKVWEIKQRYPSDSEGRPDSPWVSPSDSSPSDSGKSPLFKRRVIPVVKEEHTLTSL